MALQMLTNNGLHSLIQVLFVRLVLDPITRSTAIAVKADRTACRSTIG